MSSLHPRLPTPCGPGGCTFAGPPGLPGAGNVIFWRADTNPAILPVEAQPVSARGGDVFDIRGCRHSAVVLRAGGPTEHVRLGDGLHHIQIEVRRGSVLDGPVRLHYDLSGPAGIEPKLTALQRLAALQRLGRFPRSLYPAERGAQRWTMALRALDAVRAGVSHREIATALWGADPVARDWRGRSDYLRARVRRTVAIGEALSNGGYRRLLIG
jgi:hypothetical protein